MLKILIFIITLSYYLLAAEEEVQEGTLLNDQLEAINRQLYNDDPNAPPLDGDYGYNQNARYLDPTKMARKKYYVGISYFIGTFESNGDNTHDVKDNADIMSLRVGYIFPTNNRIELHYYHEQTLDYPTFYDEISGLRANAIVTFDLVNNNNIFGSVFAGVGYHDYISYSLRGLSVRGGVGIIGKVGPNIELDAGYSYEYIIWDDSSLVQGKGDVDNTQFLGLHYGAKYKF